MATLYAGTSGFAYTAWKPAFYPAKLPAKQFLKHYAALGAEVRNAISRFGEEVRAGSYPDDDHSF